MAQKTYKQIEAEANQKFGNKPSKEKFEWRRAQQREAGLDTEGKKRGGVAGAYDRNKALVQAAAPILAGLLIPGAQAGLAGAVTGGLFKGLDREGKSGIGLDVGQAARGALSGAALGKVGSVVGSGIGGAQAAAGSGSLSAMGRDAITAAKGEAGRQFGFLGGGTGGPAPTGGTPPAGAPPVGAPPVGAPPAGAPPVGAPPTGAAPKTMMGRFLTGAKENAPIIQAGLGAVSDVMGQQAQRAMQEQQLAQQQSQFQKTFDVGEEERRRQREQQNRLAGLFMPRSA